MKIHGVECYSTESIEKLLNVKGRTGGSLLDMIRNRMDIDNDRFFVHSGDNIYITRFGILACDLRAGSDTVLEDVYLDIGLIKFDTERIIKRGGNMGENYGDRVYQSLVESLQKEGCHSKILLALEKEPTKDRRHDMICDYCDEL